MSARSKSFASGHAHHALKREYHDALRQLTVELAGIHLGREHGFLIETRLARLAREEGFASLADMVEELFATGQNRLAVRVVSALLERDARFFDDRASLEGFETTALAALSAARQHRPRLLVFGCGAGQEVWTLAMLLRRTERRRAARGERSLQARIIGLDYPSAALERARAGVYTHFEVQRGLPAAELVENFEPVEASAQGEPGAGEHSTGEHSADWRVRDALRAAVRFEARHLLSNTTDLGGFDAVFFRGALERYVGSARERVARGVASLVAPGGFLQLGTNETLGVDGLGLEAVEGAPGLYTRPKGEDQSTR